MVILNSRPLQFAGGDRNLAGWRLYSRTATIKRDENGHVITTCRASFISLTHLAVPCHRIAGILNCHELGDGIFFLFIFPLQLNIATTAG